MPCEKPNLSSRNAYEIEWSTPSVEAMDHYLNSFAAEITSSAVCDSISRVFGIDVDRAAVLHSEYAHLENPRAAIDSYLQKHGVSGGTEIRSMVKELFGINLIGIAELHKDRISLYSKDQWIVKNDTALFHVHTGKKDIDVKILPTPYFTEQTGMTELPESLQQALTPLGFSYNQKEQAFYHRNPTGLSVHAEFKVQTMKTIAKIVHQHYADL